MEETRNSVIPFFGPKKNKKKDANVKCARPLFNVWS